MTLAEIQALKQTARAKAEDLLGRTASREMSTEEKQMLADLQAEGQRLSSLETRYAVLEQFDNPTGRAPIVRTPVPPADLKEARIKAFDTFLRTGKVATDDVLQIMQSPVDASLAAAAPTEVAGLVDAISVGDLPAELGVREFPRTSSAPLVVPHLVAATTVAIYPEGSAPTDSKKPTFKNVSLGGARYQGLTKVSYESLNNVAFNLADAVTRSLAMGQSEKQNSDFAGALEQAVNANPYCFVEGGGSDANSVLSRLFTSIKKVYQSASNRILIGPDGLLSIMDDRDNEGRPLVDVTAQTIKGRPYSVSEDISGLRIYFGNWNVGAMRSRSPLFVQVLRELYSESAHVGYSGYQWADFAFTAELTDVEKQPILFSTLETAGS